jgi:hypothetical protein
MELKEFVKETLVQIAEGVHEAGKELKPLNAAVNPSHIYTAPHIAGDCHAELAPRSTRSRTLQEIEFDVAVTTSSENGKKAGLGIFVGSVGIGAQDTTDEASHTLSRIRFKVPMVFPSDDETAEDSATRFGAEAVSTYASRHRRTDGL